MDLLREEVEDFPLVEEVAVVYITYQFYYFVDICISSLFFSLE